MSGCDDLEWRGRVFGELLMGQNMVLWRGDDAQVRNVVLIV